MSKETSIGQAVGFLLMGGLGDNQLSSDSTYVPVAIVQAGISFIKKTVLTLDCATIMFVQVMQYHVTTA